MLSQYYRRLNMTYLFTKQGCTACESIRENVDLPSVKGLKVLKLDGENSEALAMLAYYECVTLAEKQLPILVSDSREVVLGPLNITRYLKEHSG